MQRVSPRMVGLGVLTLVLGGALLVPVLSGTSSGAQSLDGCDEGEPWPFESFSCGVYQSGGARLRLADDVDPVSLPTNAQQIAEAARQEAGEGAQVLETKLVYAWSDEGSFARDAKLLWAVSLDLPGEPYVTGAPSHWKALATVRPNGGSEPLTPDEEREVDRIAEQLVLELRSQITETYHVEFFDPRTGLWLGGAEGAR